MSDAIRYDVIIAGAGPAGSTAGYILGGSGLNVLIIDKNTFPRQKLCGGCITNKTVKLLERVFGETPDSLKEKGIINFESRSYEFRSRKSLITRGRTPFPFYFVDRDRYDHFLLERARQAGAGIVEGETVRSLDILKGAVTTSEGGKFSADFIIGADGVNSRIRRSFLVELFDRPDWNLNVASAFEVSVSREKAKKQFDHPVLFFGFMDRGYAWIFPNRDRLKVGMCGLRKNNSKKIISLFKDFLSGMDLQDGPFEKIESYVVPYGNFLPAPFFRNMLLVGDAAGFADPLLGEGIFYAQRSAELAARAIMNTAKKGDNIKSACKLITDSYMRSLHEHIYPELIYAGKIQDSIFTFWNRFDFFPLKVFFGVTGKMPIETVHGIRSYRWMKKL